MVSGVQEWVQCEVCDLWQALVEGSESSHCSCGSILVRHTVMSAPKNPEVAYRLCPKNYIRMSMSDNAVG